MRSRNAERRNSHDGCGGDAGDAIRRAITLKLRPRADRYRSRDRSTRSLARDGLEVRFVRFQRKEPCGFPWDAAVGRRSTARVILASARWEAVAPRARRQVTTTEDERQKFSPSRGWIYVAASIRQIFQRVPPREIEASRDKPGSSMNNSSDGGIIPRLHTARIRLNIKTSE